MFLGVAVDNMGIYYIILGTIFIIVFGAWLSFQTGAIYKAMDLMAKDSVDKNKK
jgi:hypothetical protein